MLSTRKRVLYNAVMDNNLEELREMLSLPVSERSDSWMHIDARGYETENRTPLGLACYLGYKEIVALLLEHGASFNIESHGGLPIFETLILGHVDIAKLLIEKGALRDLENKPDLIAQVLYAAVAAGDIEILKQTLALSGSDEAVLLAFGVRVPQLKNIVDRLRDNKLSDRVYRYIVDVVAHLQGEAEFDTHRNGLGIARVSMAEGRVGLKVTAALLARLLGREDMLSLLQSHQQDAVHAQLDGRNHHGDADLVDAVLAIMNDDLEELKQVYQRGELAANVIPEDPHQASLQEIAYIAAMHGRLPMLHWLKEQGVRLTDTSEGLKNSLVEAVVEGEADAVDYLINEGADFTQPVDSGSKKISPNGERFAPLEIAAKLNAVNVIKVLLAHDAAHACVSVEALRPKDPHTIFNFLSTLSETLEINEIYSGEKWLEDAFIQHLIVMTNDKKSCELIEENGLLAFRIKNRSLAADALRHFVGVIDVVREVSDKEFIISKSVALAFLGTLRKTPASWPQYLKQFPILKEKLAKDKEAILRLFPTAFRADIKHRQTRNLLTLEMGARSAALSRPVFMALGIENPVGCRQEIVLRSDRQGLKADKLYQLLQTRENALMLFVTKARQIDKKCKVVYGETNVEIIFKNPQHTDYFHQLFPQGTSYEVIFAYDAEVLAGLQITLPEADVAMLQKTTVLNQEVQQLNQACDGISTQSGMAVWNLLEDEVVSQPLLARFAAVLRSLKLPDMVFEAGDKVIARMPAKSLIALPAVDIQNIKPQIIEGKRKIDLLDSMIIKTWLTSKRRFQAADIVFELKDLEHTNRFNECCPGLVKLLDVDRQIYSISYEAILAMDIKTIEAANAKLCHLLVTTGEKSLKVDGRAAFPVAIAAPAAPAVIAAAAAEEAVFAAAHPPIHQAQAKSSVKAPKSGKPKSAVKNKHRAANKKVTPAVSPGKSEKTSVKRKPSIAQQKINPLDMRGLPAPARYVSVTAPCNAIDFTQPLSPRRRLKGTQSRLFKPEKLDLVTEVSVSFSALLECQLLVKARSLQHGRTNKILEKMQTTIINMEVCLLDLDALWQNIRLDQSCITTLGSSIIEFLRINHQWIKTAEKDSNIKVMDKLEMICVHADVAANVWNTRLLEDLQAARDLPLPESPRMQTK